MKTMTIEEFANSLTSEQYISLVNMAFGPVDPEIDSMTDKELLKELEA